MNRPVRAVVAFVVTSLATVGVVTLSDPGYRPAAEVEPLGLGPATPTTPRADRQVERRDVAVPVPGGERSGWLFRPDVDTRAPALVLIPGAGAHRRDDLVAEAEALARAGVAALVTDKRRDGYGLLRRDFDQLAADAAASASWLGRQPGIDASRVGVMGWSEGGWIAPLAAALAPATIAYVVLVSAPVVSPVEQVGFLTERAMHAAPSWLRRPVITTLAGGPLISPSLGTDVRPQLTRLRQPVHAVWGSEDTVVPVAEAVRRLRAAVPSATVRVRPGLGHAFGATDQDWLDDVAHWIDEPGTGRGTSTGTRPRTSAGVPTAPPTRWFLHPAPHLALALVVAALAAGLPRPRAPRSTHP